MPIGATLPFTTYRDTGIQSVTNTLTPIEDENVVSEFLSQKPRTYLSGSYDSVNHPYTEELSDDITLYTFALSNSSDVISKILFNFELRATITGDGSSPTNNLASVSRTFLYDYINKVEVIIGSETWQTLTGADIFSRNVTENYYNNLFDFQFENLNLKNRGAGIISIKVGKSFNGNAINSYYKAWSTGDTILSGLVDLKIFSGSGDKNNSFLNCSAPNTEMRIRVHCNKKAYKTTRFTGGEFVPSLLSAQADFSPVDAKPSVSLIVKRHRITNVEREYAQNNIINSLIYTSQNVTNAITEECFGKDVTISINLDSITINTSHLLLTMVMTPYLPELISTFGTESTYIIANSVYYNNYSTIDSTNSRSGIFSCVKTAELFIDDSSVTGKLTGSYMLNCSPNMDLNKIASLPVYVIPLASTKFGNDSILFSKLSHKRLELVIDKDSYYVPLKAAKIIANITAVGTDVITYSGGRVRKQFAN